MTTRTAAEIRAERRVVFDAFFETCPARQLMETLGDKWTGFTIVALADGPKRRSELSERIAGASQKVLTNTLRELERDGLVTRTVTPSVPVRVDYELTELGRSLLPILASLKTWAEQNMPEVLRARDRYEGVLDGDAPSPFPD